jgi:hypothetical protein
MVEAAIALPLFLTLLLGSIRVLMICYEGIQFQYEVSETTRLTFTLDNAGRSKKLWETYFKETLANRISKSGLSGLLRRDEQGNAQLDQSKIKPKRTLKGQGQPSLASGWPGSNSQPGDTFTIEVTSDEPLLPKSFAGIESPAITLKAKAVAIINRVEGE